LRPVKKDSFLLAGRRLREFGHLTAPQNLSAPAFGRGPALLGRATLSWVVDERRNLAQLRMPDSFTDQFFSRRYFFQPSRSDNRLSQHRGRTSKKNGLPFGAHR